MILTKYFYLRNLFQINVLQYNFISQFYCFPRERTLRLISSPEICRKFSISLSLLKKQEQNEASENKHRAPTKKPTEGPQVTVITEKGSEKAMYYSEVEKYAKRNNLKIEKLEGSKHEKPAYKLVPITKLFGEKKKAESKNLKKILLRETISDHDLNIKINAALKFLEKGKEVSCIASSENDPKKFKELYDKILNSAIGEYISQNKKTDRRILLLFKPKVSEAAKSEEKIDDKERKTEGES